MKVVLLLYMVIYLLIVLNTLALGHIVFDYALLFSFYRNKLVILSLRPILSTGIAMSTLVELFTSFTSPLSAAIECSGTALALFTSFACSSVASIQKRRNSSNNHR